MSKRIIVSSLQKDWEEDYLQERLPDFELVQVSTIADTDGDDQAQAINIFINDKIGPEVLDKFPNLKLIHTRSTGFDHVDLDAAQQKDIAVTNVPDYGDNTVAEHTFALILSLSRNLRRAYLKTLNNDFNLEGLMGMDLKDKTIGVIGTGKIGLRVMQIARGFSMKVIAFDPKVNELMADVLGYKYVKLNELLAQANIITLHAPYNKHTHHLINADSFKQIKQKPLLINTARGGLIATEALIKALDDGVISGAGLDVIECEEALFSDEDCRLSGQCDCGHHIEIIRSMNLLKRDNVVFTPHMAFDSKEAVERILNTSVLNIKSFFDNKPINVVS